MKRLSLLAMLVAFSALGCRNECEEATDHWEDCMEREDQIPPLTDDECSGVAECKAKCINDAECLDLQKFSDPSSTYYQCTSKC